MNPDAAAEYVHLSPESLRRAIQRGDLTCARLGRLALALLGEPVREADLLQAAMHDQAAHRAPAL